MWTRWRIWVGLGILAAAAASIFMNCSGGLPNLGDSKASGSTSPAPVSPYYVSPISMAELQTQRTANWTHSFDGWEVDYEGIDTPAEHVPQYAVWDNPIDDDWNEPRVVASSFSFNTPVAGFLTIDRVSNPLDLPKNGGIWRRDEYLSGAQGMTTEFRFKTYANSDPDTIVYEIVLDTGSVSLFFSPTTVKLGNIGGTDIRSTATVDTTVFHTYRVTWFTNNYVEVYLDGSVTALVSGYVYSLPKTGEVSLTYPELVFGDNAGGPSVGGHYTLDYIKYRRGALQSLSALTPIATRTPPTLPQPASAAETFSGSNTGLFSSDSIPSNFTAMSAASWTVVPHQPIEHNSVAGNETAVVIADPVPGLINQNGYTLEMRIKMFADTMDQGFGVSVLDQMGTITLVISKDKVESQVGLKPVGYQTVKMDLTNTFHIIRLVRPANSMYAYVYLDNDPVPALVDIHLSMETEVHGYPVQPYMQFGNLWYINRTLAKNVRAHALIDYIRWHDGAVAPPPKN